MTAGGIDPPEARREPAPAGTWRGLYGLVALGLGLRLAVAFASDSVHHPDEVFQYAEQAHRLVFRYGVIPWEYRFGARSWLLPLFISGPLEAARLLRLDDPAYYIPLVKIVFCLLSVTLVVSVYRIGRNPSPRPSAGLRQCSPASGTSCSTLRRGPWPTSSRRTSSCSPSPAPRSAPDARAPSSSA